MKIYTIFFYTFNNAIYNHPRQPRCNLLARGITFWQAKVYQHLPRGIL